MTLTKALNSLDDIQLFNFLLYACKFASKQVESDYKIETYQSNLVTLTVKQYFSNKLSEISISSLEDSSDNDSRITDQFPQLP